MLDKTNLDCAGFIADANRMADDDAPPEVLGIVEKKVFIKSSVSLENLDIIRKKGGLVNFLGDVMGGIGGGVKDILKTLSGSTTTRTDQVKLDTQKTMQKIAQVSEKGLLLPLLFKQIDAIGYIDDRCAHGKDDTRKTRPIQTDDKIAEPSVCWLNNHLTFSEHTGHGLFRAIAGIVQLLDGTLNENEVTTSRIGRKVTSIMGLVMVLIVAFSTVGAGGLALFIMPLIGLIHLYRWWTASSKNPDDILRNKETLVIFNILKTGTLETESLDTSLGELLIDSINKACQSELLSMELFARMLSTLITTLKGVVGAEEVSVKRKFTQPTRTQGTAKYETPVHDARRDLMKRQLTNLNMPIESFYYALTLVKSTYVKRMGDDVRKYHDNKDAFMVEYAKRKK
jgi:hypothetical protein